MAENRLQWSEEEVVQAEHFRSWFTHQTLEQALRTQQLPPSALKLQRATRCIDSGLLGIDSCLDIFNALFLKSPGLYNK